MSNYGVVRFQSLKNRPKFACQDGGFSQTVTISYIGIYAFKIIHGLVFLKILIMFIHYSIDIHIFMHH